MDEYRRANQDLWDEYTRINAASSMYDLAGFKAGRNALHPLEIQELGDVRGKSLLHLQCHFGMDTLTWARLGAQVTGVDFAPDAVRLARSLAGELGLAARFIQSDLYDLPNHLDETFDIVFTSYGALTWLSDIPGWAQVAARYVRPGGTFYIAEFHPAACMFSDESDRLGSQHGLLQQRGADLPGAGVVRRPDGRHTVQKLIRVELSPGNGGQQPDCSRAAAGVPARIRLLGLPGL